MVPWGAAANRGRIYTLLPMLRKFIATTLLVMVVLVVLSSLGIDIGPLLAGAGVVGLAIGFGAQKLVSDVFSGFFYLLDDAFRVGEYIQPGTHFVIRREAYRRITAALAAQEINYAHRKVIVVIPEHTEKMLQEEDKKILEGEQQRL